MMKLMVWSDWVKDEQGLRIVFGADLSTWSFWWNRRAANWSQKIQGPRLTEQSDDCEPRTDKLDVTDGMIKDLMNEVTNEWEGPPLGRRLLPAGMPELTGNRKPAEKNINFIQQDQMNPPEKLSRFF